MAEATVSASDREMRFEMLSDHYFRIIGSAAQLHAEGLIPDGLTWPDADRWERWERGGISYRLSRVRPHGHKGLKRTWLALDHWCLFGSVPGRGGDWVARRRLERKAEELRAEAHMLTPQGKAEWLANWRAIEASRADKHFQAFKALLPGLVKPRRARKPESASGA